MFWDALGMEWSQDGMGGNGMGCDGGGGMAYIYVLVCI